MVYYVENIKKVKFVLPKNNATIGFFDGVHRGHQFLLEKLQAIDVDMPITVITFDTHFGKESLTCFEDKVALLTAFGVDNIVVIANNQHNFLVTKSEFIDFLSKLQIKNIVCGADFKFGHQASGDVKYLATRFHVDVVDYKNADGNKISSRDIRRHLDAGQIEVASNKLGRHHFVRGTVQHGNQIGRTINFPTANITTDFYLPGQGVYVTKTQINDKLYLSVTNIGIRPTLLGQEQRIETHILDFDQDIYGMEIKVEFVHLIRHEVKFSNLGELQAQIAKDIKIARDYYGD